MKNLLTVTLCTLTALALAEEPIALHYHERVGIPEATRIKHAEFAIDSRIIGGEPTSVSTYPFMVRLLITSSGGETSLCSSSMLSNTRALTAAHCWWDGNYQAVQFTLVFGSARLFFGGTRVNTSSVQMHSEYNPKKFSNDIAVIYFNFVPYSNVIRAVALPSGALLSSNFAGSRARVAGYGKSSDNVDIWNNGLRHVSLQVITNADCAQFFGGTITSSTLCTSGSSGHSAVGACNGDSGGPLFISSGSQHVVIGVTSFVWRKGCELRFPSVFTRVTSFLTWIQARL